MVWSLELFRSLDGLRLGLLPEASFSWSRTVRDGKMAEPPQGAGQQSLSSFSFSLGALEHAGWIDRDEPGWQARLLATFMPHRLGVMALYDGLPIVGGPISDPVKVDAGGVAITVDGPTAFLAHRYVVPEAFAADRQIAFRGRDLGSIAQEVVKVALTKPGGSLPITFDPVRSGTHERTYQAFNVANLQVSDVLEKIANVIGGPDIDFRPYVVDAKHFAWHMHTGTQTDPWIGQGTVHSWEVGSPDVETLTGDYSAAFTAHRVYGVGGGQDVGTVVTRVGVGDTAGVTLPPDWPLREAVHSNSDVDGAEKVGVLRAGAEGMLLNYPILQPQLVVRADGSTPLGTFWPGELAEVSVMGHSVLADGTHTLRILGMSGSNSRSVSLVFDPVEVASW